MFWRPSSYKVFLQLADGLTTAVSIVLSYIAWDYFRLKTGIPRPMTISVYTYWIVFGLSVIWALLFSLQRAYSKLRFSSLGREIRIVALTTTYGIALLMLANFIFRFGHLPRTYVAFFATASFVSLAAEKTIIYYAVKALRNAGRTRRKILIVGTGKETGEFIGLVEKNYGKAVNIIGLVETGQNDCAQCKWERKILGTANQIERILHENVIDEVIICNSGNDVEKTSDVLECCGREGVQVRVYSDYLRRIARKIRVDDFFGLSVLSLVNTPDDELALGVKRVIDVIVSGILLILLSPVFLLIGLLIKATSKGPVFYRWNVVGLNKKPFRSWKFRTMRPDADELKKDLMGRNEMNGPVFKIKDDPRITGIGKILRKFSLDELPQLWSVFKGDMSLVGPRPAGPHELARYESWHRKKLSIKPGITCLWQVAGRNRIKDFDEWVKLDLAYIENWSLGLDIKILLKTIPAVFRGTGV